MYSDENLQQTSLCAWGQLAGLSALFPESSAPREAGQARSPLVSVLSSVWKAEAGRASHVAVGKDVSLPVFIGRMWSPEQVHSPLAVHSGAWLLPSIYERAMLAGDWACDRGQGAWLLALLTPRSKVVKGPRKHPSWDKAESNLSQRTLGLNKIRTLLFHWNHQLISHCVLEFWGWG